MTARGCTDPAGVERLRALLARERELYEVVATPGGAAWRRSSALTPFGWDAALPLEGVKPFFFPRVELEGFQREASGHHPAPRAGDRVRRFWTHKLGAELAREAGRLGCVGCGRCDVTCPGSIGAHRVLGALGRAT
ncbi:MAG: 4Fe-4S dicluster domain-containing protein [Thermodesulfobacteriota bacterium]